jgi:very-short-patch-repair endonuclease
MSPDAIIASVAERQHGAFSAKQATQAGITARMRKGRIASGRWRPLHRGVYAIAGTRPSRSRQVMSAVLAAGPSAAASHRSAAALLGLISGDEGPVHVVVAPSLHLAGRRGVVVHRANLRVNDIRRVDNIPVTAAHRTLVDLAGVVRADVLAGAVDRSLIRGLTTVPRVAAYVHEQHLTNRRGVDKLARLLVDRSNGALESELERRFEGKLERSPLPAPVRQYPFGAHRIDFAYPDHRIAIELDGLAVHGTALALGKDLLRQNTLVLGGWLVLRFTWHDVVTEWTRTRRTIEDALRIRTAVG